MLTTRQRRALLLGIALNAVGVVSYVHAQTNNFDVFTRLIGYEEVPAISTTGRGVFRAEVRGGEIRYHLEYFNLEGTATVSHIHFGQRSVNGGISAFLCGGNNKPACPPSGTVEGVITAADIIGPTAQGIEPGAFQELIAAMQAGVTYANVHSTKWPGGEIRGQIGPDPLSTLK
jgi:hypothetical protein